MTAFDDSALSAVRTWELNPVRIANRSAKSRIDVHKRFLLNFDVLRNDSLTLLLHALDSGRSLSLPVHTDSLDHGQRHFLCLFLHPLLSRVNVIPLTSL
jgi:hypothetical protein